MEPKDTTTDRGYMGMTNTNCPFLPCHTGVKREFNCLFCYCPLYAYDCIGFYEVFIDRHGTPRKNCMWCKLPHDGYEGSWKFIQKGMERLVLWNGKPRTGS